MSKGSKILLGICVFLPSVLTLALVIFYLLILRRYALGHASRMDMWAGLPDYLDGKSVLNLWELLVVSTYVFLLIRFTVHLVQQKGSDVRKSTWFLLLVFTAPVSTVIYFFYKIVPETRSGGSTMHFGA